MKAPLIPGLITLIAVGDVMLGDSPLCPGHGVGSLIKKEGVVPLFEQVAPIMKKGDIVFGNLEAVLSSKGINPRKTNSLLMRAAPQSVKGLKLVGFNVFSIANNHSLEHGEQTVTETKDILSRHGIKHVGIGRTSAESRQPLILEIKGINIAFLAYCLVPDKTAYISTDDPEEICSDVKKAKARADLAVVSIHWGNEYMEKPSPYQIVLAHRIIDSGTDVILGHHPHVLQGIEIYHNGLIAYSLGNFIFGMNYIEETRESIILNCQLSKHGVVGYELHPLYSKEKYNPVILGGEDRIRVLTRLKQLSSKLEKDSACNTQEYEKKVTELRTSASKRMMKYFLLNIYRYPPLFTIKTILNYLKKCIK
jgi:poly-gamma-glutamate synthesis protein (capsule biosynthesis protein)